MLGTRVGAAERLDPPLRGGYLWILFFRVFPSKEGFDFGFLFRWIYPQIRRSYYLFFTTCSLLLVYVFAFTGGSRLNVFAFTGGSRLNVFAFTVENCPGSQRSVENPRPNGPEEARSGLFSGPEAKTHCSPDRSQQRARIGRE